MVIEPLGEAAYLLRDLSHPPYAVANALNASPPPGMFEAVASYECVGVYVDPEVFDVSSLALLPTPKAQVGRCHRIPVCYAIGEDLAEVAALRALAPENVIAAHAGTKYRCAAVGFRPGFAYLGELPDAIADLPRRAVPRVRVEEGSVAITGRQTGVYPQDGPGGWWILGRTPLILVDVESNYFPIEAGDEVEFVPITEEEFAQRDGERL